MGLQGAVKPGFETLIDAFAEVLTGRKGSGAGLAIWHDGAWVADLWGGWANAEGTRDWGRSSIVMPYSVTKPFVAVCALTLVARGLLDLDAPVQRYWPEFRTAATVRQVLSHQAGVVALDEPAPAELFYDWDALCSRLAAQEPAWEPGTAHGESAMFYGHLVGELVRRVDGRRLGRFLREEVCGPAQIDFIVGLDEPDLARTVDITGLDDAFRAQMAHGRPELYRLAFENPPGALDPEVVNGAAWRASEIPALNGHGTARGVAGLYVALLLGELLPEGLTREATSVQSSGVDRVFGVENAWGLGFGVEPDSFGMGGVGGSFGGVNTEARYAFGFVTGHMVTQEPSILLENAFRACLGLSAIEF